MSLPVPTDQKYTSKKYANVEDFIHELGLTQKQFQELDFETRNRFQSWVLNGQNQIEAIISDLSDDTQLAENTEEFTLARNAVMAWAMYQKRVKDGSPSKEDYLTIYRETVKGLTVLLHKKRTTRTRTASIQGKTFKNTRILLPSQLDTAFYNDI